MSWFRRTSKPSEQPATQPPASAPVPASSPTDTAPQPPSAVAPQQPAVAAPVTFDAAPSMVSTMMDYPLTLQHVMNRGRQYFPKTEVVTLTPDGYDTTTFADIFARVERLAGALQALGVKRGDRVATLAWNSARHYELYFAVPCMGAVLHTLNLRLAPHQAGYIVKDAADSVIFVDADLFPLLNGIKDSLGSVKHIVIMGGPIPENTEGLPPVHDYEALLASAPASFDWPKLDEHEPASMCYTSGTTGNPKGVVYSHRSSYLHAIAVTQVDTIGLSNRDVVMPLVPMFHVNAWGLPHAAAMVGSKLVFPGRFMGDPTRMAQTIHDHRVTLPAGVPTIWIGMVQVLSQRTDLDMTSVERVVVGGSAAPASLIAAMDEKRLPLLHAWGMTETSPIATISRLKNTLANKSPDEKLAYRAKQGFAVTGVDLRIMNLDTGEEAPWDGTTFGEIQVRGPWITGSYYHGDDQEMGASKFMDGWFRTGDVATIDAEGYIQIVDRTKDVIKSGGEWISSVQMEGIIMGNPKVLEAAVIGLPHPKWAERPVAIVVPKPEFKDTLTKEDIIQGLESQVAKWWLPDEVLFVDALPKTSVGKFDKKVMRAQIAEQVHLGEEP